MSRDLNRAEIIGVVGLDPETRFCADGQPVTAFPLLAATQRLTTQGQVQRANEWFTVVIWNSPADAMSSQLRRNLRVYTEGRIQTRWWEEPGGERRCRAELVASRVIPLDYTESGLPGFRHLVDEMPVCLNRATLIGTVRQRPEMRYAQDGQAVTSFSLAATHSSNAPEHEGREQAEWFSVRASGVNAEFCSRRLAEGHRLYVEGEFRMRSSQRPAGARHIPVELLASQIILLH